MTSRNYLFNSIKENIRRNFYLFILTMLGFLAVFPLRTIMVLDRAKSIIPPVEPAGLERAPVQTEFLNCIEIENGHSFCWSNRYFIGSYGLLLSVFR